MTPEQLSSILFEGEGLTVEFKRKVSSPEKNSEGDDCLCEHLWWGFNFWD
ncbi:hypothetical protein JGI11_01002 [Candidatus Kryptonium thompsonii]|nr:hypothetical protein JGI11_01002 [Candidatus Kryptonium thompsoni]